MVRLDRLSTTLGIHPRLSRPNNRSRSAISYAMRPVNRQHRQMTPRRIPSRIPPRPPSKSIHSQAHLDIHLKPAKRVACSGGVLKAMASAQWRLPIFRRLLPRSITGPSSKDSPNPFSDFHQIGSSHNQHPRPGPSLSPCPHYRALKAAGPPSTTKPNVSKPHSKLN